MIKYISVLAFMLTGLAGTVSAQDARLASGKALYQENCASCHGSNLEGQADWKIRLPNGRLPAPPHDESGHTWHHPDRVLVEIVNRGTAAIVGGGYESDMPGFGDVLSDEEVIAILDYIKSTWPARARDAQAKITQGDEEARK
ncbi:cytochrome c [Sulfitobacter sp.]|jgi:mono/diheme cytochrome c family protein|uniref:cytochrome c n=1 Tax=Sulfitobacter sp. TaxID=1903071 RepID=UPI000C10D378|nr:cytochrome C [Roseobacter sp.]MBV50258.1 cytochrome C [Roseobacter sp.]PHR10029.1 MAG: cytochrome C [Sulfitobacter sp.]